MPGAGLSAAGMAPGRPGRLRRAGGALLAVLVAPAVAAAALPAALPMPIHRGGPLIAPRVAPLGHRWQATLLVVAPDALPTGVSAAVRRLHGVAAAEPVDAARIRVNGTQAAVLGVDPSSFRGFAAGPTAADNAFWASVAEGDIAVSYTMGKQDKLPPGSLVPVTGRRREVLAVGELGTVGVAGVDAVISATVARSLGFPQGNALVISAPHARMAALTARVRSLVPASAVVEQLAAASAPSAAGRAGAPKAPATGGPATGGPAGRPAAPRHRAAAGATLTHSQVLAMLRAAVSRVGMPYVWGAAGPASFDCSGLVQWSFAQAGVVMPRVAADQARTGPAVPVSRLAPGDLLFYHTDPTAPGYISHVAIYLGHSRMIQAPQPGMNVEIVPLALGSEFAGAVSVSPALAARVAASPVG